MRGSDQRSPTTTGGPDPLESLLGRLDADRGRAGESYNSYRARLVRHFTWQGCAPAEDLADEVLDRVARRLAQGEQIPRIGAYFLGVARLVVLEHRRRESQSASRLDEYARRVAPSDPAGREAEAACLDRCLAALPADRRDLVLAYYSAEGRSHDERQRLARALGLQMNALRNRVLRARQQLETCVGACLDREPSRDERTGNVTSVRDAPSVPRPRR